MQNLPGRKERQDYGWGVRVRRHFGARGMSSVRYGIRLGDLKNKQPINNPSFTRAPMLTGAPNKGHQVTKSPRVGVDRHSQRLS